MGASRGCDLDRTVARPGEIRSPAVKIPPNANRVAAKPIAARAIQAVWEVGNRHLAAIPAVSSTAPASSARNAAK
jgi:hypothetical protein